MSARVCRCGSAASRGLIVVDVGSGLDRVLFYCDAHYAAGVRKAFLRPGLRVVGSYRLAESAA